MGVIKIDFSSLPIFSVEATDWGAVWAELEQGKEPCYSCTAGQTREFWAWAQRKHGKPIYYKTVAPGVVQFTLEAQRKGAGNRTKVKGRPVSTKKEARHAAR